ncbi:hypothetical protein H257_10706 [Aphanomyces astaci]|uniref:DDE Tnp4 domain-containing protein n=1 Tax=Aphanomyces astaci TaxID=112090 RepID=W4G4E4_APHAT|nr:hypothetical protein H257_10706 [Aphanomyces astaci]ETV74557.1 hypothetical protein H257_10706 [Aphanomyces astaci]|eukprot:XP_009835644.1 hypothetical protein H257_10706 [Aphanomyces astaci]
MASLYVFTRQYSSQFRADGTGLYDGRVVYGDPAYGCNQFLICPFPLNGTHKRQRRFNSQMSKVREAVEWNFGRLKILWPFVVDSKKMQVGRTLVGKLFYVSALLTNCHCCMQPMGNQISIYQKFLRLFVEGEITFMLFTVTLILSPCTFFFKHIFLFEPVFEK